MDRLPHDLIIRISDLLSTIDRARLAVLSKEWQRVITDSWTAIGVEAEEGCQLQKQFDWLRRLAARHPDTTHTLQSLCIQVQCEYDDIQYLPSYLRLHQFSRLRTLDLRPSSAGGNLFPAIFRIEDLQSLEALTCLEHLSLNLPRKRFLDGFEAYSEGADDGLLLDSFAVLPRLRELKLFMISVGHSSSPTVAVTPALRSSGFQSLKSLLLDGVGLLDHHTMADTVSRLETLYLETNAPGSVMMSAPNLTYLNYKVYWFNPDTTKTIPFRTSASLLSLSAESISVPKDLPAMSCNIVSLCLQDLPEEFRSWSALRGLTHLSIEDFETQDGSIIQPFTTLFRLRSLYIAGFNKNRGDLRIIGPAETMANLTKLVIKSGHSAVCRTFDVDNLALGLPALQEFDIILARSDASTIMGGMSSGTLQVLRISYGYLLHQSPQSSWVRELSCLYTLTVRADTDFYDEKEMLAQSLSVLTSLRELFVISRLQYCSSNNKLELPNEYRDGQMLSDSYDGDARNTIDTLLHALQATTELRALKIVIPDSDLTLSLVNFPHLVSLAVGCMAVNLSHLSHPPSPLLAQDCHIDVHFLQTDDHVLDQAQQCMGMEVTAKGGPGWQFFNIHRRGNQNLKDGYLFRHSAHLLANCRKCNGSSYGFRCQGVQDCLDSRYKSNVNFYHVFCHALQYNDARDDHLDEY